MCWRQYLPIVGLVGSLAALAGRVSAADVQAKLDQLNQREKQLIEKLEAAQQRERDIQSRLDEVRHRKEYLLNQQALHKPGHHNESPSPTPAP